MHLIRDFGGEIVDIEPLIKFIRKYGPVLIAAVIVVTPIMWKVTSALYNERIQALNARIDLLTDQKRMLEEKLRLPLPPDIPEARSGDPLRETSRLPYIANPKNPTKDEVRELARFYGLFNNWKINPHLRFKEGDVLYWHEKGLSEDAIKREFESRRTVLQRAEQTGEVIKSQGDLSDKAEQLQDDGMR